MTTHTLPDLPEPAVAQPGAEPVPLAAELWHRAAMQAAGGVR